MPLANNFLKEAQGFNLHIPQGKLSSKYPAWVQALRSFPEITSSESFNKKCGDCRNKLDIANAERVLDTEEINHLHKISHEVEKILEPKISNKLPHVETIRRCAFKLFVLPEKNLRAFLSRSFPVFFFYRGEFREMLKEVVPDESICDRILRGLEEGNIDRIAGDLIREFPTLANKISKAKDKAKQMCLEKQKAGEPVIHSYWQKTVGIERFVWLAFDNLDLLMEYQMLQEGRYLSSNDIPKGIGSHKIYIPSYLKRLGSLVDACIQLKTHRFDKKPFENYLQEHRKHIHFHDVLVPLLTYVEVVDTLLLWPAIYEPSEAELKFLTCTTSFLKGIANKNLLGNNGRKERISYEYLSIPEEKIKSEIKILNSKTESISRKRQSCRILYHSRIPWEALRNIGNLMSGDRSELVQWQFFTKTFVNIIKELPEVRESMQALIDFEMTEFNPEPSLPSQEFCSPKYKWINDVGSFVKSRSNLSGCVENLDYFSNVTLTQDDYSTPKIQYAIVRELQIVGEIVKNLRKTGLLENNELWDKLQDIRDALSHPEQAKNYTKVINLFTVTENHHYFILLLKDIRIIRDYFNNLLKNFDTLDKFINYMSAKEELSSELPGIAKFHNFLCGKLSVELETELRETVFNEESKKTRANIVNVRDSFIGWLKGDLKENYDYENALKILPLTIRQKKEARSGIKICLRQNATNNAKEAKSAILNKILQIVKSSYSSISNTENFVNCLEKHVAELSTKTIVDQFELKKTIDIFQIIFKKTKSSEQLEFIRENLLYLGETVKELQERKKKQVLSILQKISEPAVDTECEKLLNQLDQVSDQVLIQKLNMLGVPLKEQQKWTNCKLQIKKPKRPTKGFLDGKAKVNELANIEREITTILNALECLSKFFSDSTDLAKDSLLWLATQYIISNFRASARKLETSLGWLQNSLPRELSSYSQFCNDLQRELLAHVEHGNKILHVSEIAEPGTVTSAGHRFYGQSYVASLINNKRDMFLESLKHKLEKLTILVNICKTENK